MGQLGGREDLLGIGRSAFIPGSATTMVFRCSWDSRNSQPAWPMIGGDGSSNPHLESGGSTHSLTGFPLCLLSPVPASLLALGLKHFEGTEFPKPLISRYLLVTKTARQLTVRIKNLNMNRVPDNILKVSGAPGGLLWCGVGNSSSCVSWPRRLQSQEDDHMGWVGLQFGGLQGCWISA